ncbi:PREDICTED: leucine-rich repeat protein soc-2-like [Eufriesea mexicana]|uniref:leucine-rich repeat protein soc-2-like n=1 Tax=Eufriesea mexicana TaxID=516756 RepID=UPI00083C7F6E|nr:PREDICTED: leucine-rich repeat protein soc-2-like [Eufriesea mexicana]
MTQNSSMISLPNDKMILNVASNDTSCENDLNPLLAKENNKQITNMTEKQIIENLFLSRNQQHYFSNGFNEHLSKLVDLNLCNSQLHDLPNYLNMLKGLTYLNLNNNNFVSLPNVICELCNLKKLWACENQIQRIPSNLGNLTNLEILSLNMNQLTDLPNSCAKLNRLEVCYISCNLFKRIPKCVAKGMKNLQILDFSQNWNSELNIYPRSVNLTMFYANGNSISPSFPKWILSPKYKKLHTVSLNDTRFRTFNLPKKSTISYVKRLSMKQCNLSEVFLETIISGMINLEELTVGNEKFKYQNYFPTMPIRTKKRPSSLKEIDMRNTGLPVVCEIINKFVNLTNINLSFNNIHFLPEEICSLKNLSRLIMDNNKLMNLPEKIGELMLLKELKLRHNHLSRLPDSVKFLKNLEYMDLYNNDFETVPEVILNLPKLKGLDLEQNYFQTENLWHTRDLCYEHMRETLRNYWLDSLFGYESICGRKECPSLDNEINSPSSLRSYESNFSAEKHTLCSVSETTYNELLKEHWDTSEDSSDEFDPHEYKNLKKQYYSAFTFYTPVQQMYCPAIFHEISVQTRVKNMLQSGVLVWSSNYEEDQFEDP